MKSIIRKFLEFVSKHYRHLIFIFFLALIWIVFLLVVRSCDFTKRPPIKESLLEDYPVVIDGTSIASTPSSLICLDMEVCKVIEAYGKKSLIVGIDDDNSHEGFSTVEKVGTNIDLDVQKIIESACELVITTEPIQYKDMVELNDNNIEIITMTDASTFDEKITLLFEGNEQGEQQEEQE